MILIIDFIKPFFFLLLGCWIWRGLDVPSEPLEYFDIEKVCSENDVSRKKVNNFFSLVEGGKFEELTIQKLVCFK